MRWIINGIHPRSSAGAFIYHQAACLPYIMIAGSKYKIGHIGSLVDKCIDGVIGCDIIDF